MRLSNKHMFFFGLVLVEMRNEKCRMDGWVDEWMDDLLIGGFE